MSKPASSAAAPPTANISARIPRDLAAEYDRAAAETKRHKTQLITEALRLYAGVLRAGYMAAPDPMLAGRRMAGSDEDRTE